MPRWLSEVGAQSAEFQTSATEESNEVERLSSDGIRAYKAKRYEEAIGFFQQALAIQPVPNLLYNIARAYELSGDDKRSAFYYQKFLKSDGISDGAREKAQGRLGEVEARLAVVVNPEPAEAESSEGQFTVVGGVSGGREDSNEALIWTALGTGGALLLASTALAIRAGSEMDSFKQADTLQEKEAYRSNAEALALATDIGLGLGTALVGVGVMMLILEGTGGETTQVSERGEIEILRSFHRTLLDFQVGCCSSDEGSTKQRIRGDSIAWREPP